MRWSDMDAYRHVNNTAYLTYLEHARVAMFFHRFESFSNGTVIAKHEIEYRRPIVYHPEPLQHRGLWIDKHPGRVVRGALRGARPTACSPRGRPPQCVTVDFDRRSTRAGSPTRNAASCADSPMTSAPTRGRSDGDLDARRGRPRCPWHELAPVLRRAVGLEARQPRPVAVGVTGTAPPRSSGCPSPCWCPAPSAVEARRPRSMSATSPPARPITLAWLDGESPTAPPEPRDHGVAHRAAAGRRAGQRIETVPGRRRSGRWCASGAAMTLQATLPPARACPAPSRRQDVADALLDSDRPHRRRRRGRPVPR